MAQVDINKIMVVNENPRSNFDEEIKISQLIQIFIGFAAIFSAIIALAISDKKTFRLTGN